MTFDDTDTLIEILAAFRRGQAKRRPMDLQSDLVEGWEFVATCMGLKPSFFAMIEEAESGDVFREAAKLAVPGLLWGTTIIDIHHVYRLFQIGSAPLRAAIEAHAQVIHPIFWASRDAMLAARYRDGTANQVNDEVLLGYPICCASWHYDYFFARGIEAACAVVTVGGREAELLDLVSRGWRPDPGYFMPDELFLAAVLRSNIRFPFVSHVACPDCLERDDSPTAAQNRSSERLARAIEPMAVEPLSRWVEDQKQKVKLIDDRTASIIESYAKERAASIREYDEYKRHARHLAKGLRPGAN